MAKFFRVLLRSKKSKARLGEIRTSHGVVKTPSFVAVGTKGTIKSLPPSFLEEIGTQVAFVNTYHLLTHPGVEVIEKAGGIHKYSGLNIPLMSDSGGFQVFSLVRKKSVRTQNSQEPIIVKISDEGVKFRSPFEGKILELTPEKSIDFQIKIGTDIWMAFDECIDYGSTYQYTKEATERTHRWLKRCINWKKSQRQNSKHGSGALYGIIQGGVFEDLRKLSAKFVTAQPVEGVAIGGVSVGETKKEMREEVKWVSFYLPKDRPVHLLGVGQFDDIWETVKYGVDTFDCVEPTRLARMGTIYQMDNFLKKESPGLPPARGAIDILKGVYKDNFEAVDKNCSCFVCQNFTKSYLHHLFKTRELLGYTLATYHNLWVMERFFEKIREAIAKELI